MAGFTLDFRADTRVGIEFDKSVSLTVPRATVLCGALTLGVIIANSVICCLHVDCGNAYCDLSRPIESGSFQSGPRRRAEHNQRRHSSSKTIG